MINQKLYNYIKSPPTNPGCYIYRDVNNVVLYVGKAKNISKRVNQYFHHFEKLEPKIQIMLSIATSIEFIEVNNEIEAFVLEANLIKKYKPKYNKQMKDDKKYVWIKIDKKEDFPRINIIRDKVGKGKYFGPYPSKVTVENLLKRLRKIFPYRDCQRHITYENGQCISSDKKPCLYFHLCLCNAPCANKTDKKNYLNNINSIQSIFSGKINYLLTDLEKNMNKYSDEFHYEEAAIIRDRIKELKYATEQIILDYGMDEFALKNAQDTMINSALELLINNLKFEGLSVIPDFRIECYDISNIQGKNATGSMVVFIDGKPKNGHYRKFQIQTKDTPDDFLMMQEMLTRRFKRLNSDDFSFKQKPNLIIIDGGKGQLSSAFEILHNLNIDIPIIGLAKREEEIVKVILDDNNKLKFSVKKLRDRSKELFLIQRIRDEAHRFAISYHRLLRSKSQVVTTLDSIPGIGPKTKKKLLLKFGSWTGIRKASIKELKEILHNKTQLEEILKRK